MEVQMVWPGSLVCQEDNKGCRLSLSCCWSSLWYYKVVFGQIFHTFCLESSVGMGLCCRNVLTSGFINLGPSFYLVLFCWGFFKPFCCVFFLYLNVWNACPRSVFLLGQQAKELCLWYAAILFPSFWYRIFCWWVIHAVVLPEWRPFGHYINSIFLNFSAGNSVLETLSREQHS